MKSTAVLSVEAYFVGRFKKFKQGTPFTRANLTARRCQLTMM